MPTVETIFIDASTGKAIGRVDMPGERLPASFAPETTLHIADEDWQVIKAEPMTAEEFLQTGKLVLTLQKIIKMSPKDILLTLPTICDEIPALLAGSTKRGKNVLELHEDDWRQIEFLSSSYRGVIEAELAQVRRIYREASVFDGSFLAFKTLHLRQQLNTPLHGGLPLNQLAPFFTSVPESYEGVAYQHTDGLIEGGFAFRVAAVLLYGQQFEGIVKILGLKIIKDVPGEYKETAHALERFMAAYHLYLIDWCKPQLLMANAEVLEAFLEG